MSAKTTDVLFDAARVAAALVTQNPDLPAPNMKISSFVPGEVELSFHDGPAGFEAWREALDIDPQDVTFDGTDAGDLAWLIAYDSTQYASVTVKLIGYTAVSAPITRSGISEVAA